MHVETVHVRFDHVGEDKKWEDFFPEWIDEDHKWVPPACPDIPMPAQDYRYLDVIVARVPCRGDGDAGGGMRDVFRLQVNLVVANLAVESGWVKPDVDQAVYVVFVGSCGAMVEMFRCDDLVEHAGDYWVYKPDLRRLKHKVLMPVGSCQIAPAYAQTGEFCFFFFFSLVSRKHFVCVLDGE
ncbi:putative UDP-glucuronate:xylan alpha-glucuronosyltransferase 5 [Citrus sinensis]|nr:putative UDP-glucuronate:xylan alpha-glucuronosyltransferase 5 [Citrus sinensis]